MGIDWPLNYLMIFATVIKPIADLPGLAEWMQEMILVNRQKASIKA